MLRLTPGCPVYLAVGPTDLRNNIDGLALIIENHFKLDPFSNALFVFCNRSRDKLKILFWDKNGFWLYYKRLEKGLFKWPTAVPGKKTITVTEQQLSWLLDGLNLDEPFAFDEVKARKLL
ncbi:MAG: IS66 family insertion sequence element accessory protein TnpB [Pseudobutyrivibrio sp.]|nr:IS66 family insertion sequence element accessory protein TnpB [Pseudobutyrivibrio sp.]